MQLVRGLLGEDPERTTPSPFKVIQDPLLKLQMAANIEPFTAFCHHAKLDWKERFQRNWLNSLGEDQICNNAFIQAKEKTMVELSSWSQMFEGKSFEWTLQENYESIVKFVLANNRLLNTRNMFFKYEDWDGNKIFKQCLFAVTTTTRLDNHFYILDKDWKVIEMLLDNTEVLKLDTIIGLWMPLDFRSNKLFIDAWKNNKSRLIEILIEKAKRFSIDGEKLLVDACQEKNWKFAEMLYKNSTSLNINFDNFKFADGAKTFIDSCESGQFFISEMLVKHSNALGIDLNAGDSSGFTGFHYACVRYSFRKADIVEMLITNSKDFNIDLNAKTKYGKTGFHLACTLGHKAIVELIVDNSQDFNIDLTVRDQDGQTGYQIAQKQRKYEIVLLLESRISFHNLLYRHSSFNAVLL